MNKKHINPKRKGRSLQRQRALDVLFEADTRAIPVSELGQLLSERKTISTAQQPIGEYGIKLVETYIEWSEEVDSMIDAASPSWSLDRMSGVDRNLLRLGSVEIMFLDVDVPVVVKEISSLARDLSTDKAVGFTMGVLNRVSEIHKLERSGLEGNNTDNSGENASSSSGKSGIF
ncbi:transcription antitermination protein NusB [Arcanobacterium ihumii]|uniref:transcription antitermination protein NusB n=1 Tax=Arcanobacterium ihumii TaxID=2138162 RepID=UPI000F52CFF0|nr:transcription antitermination protein NusB [Arcanobacterium ihumii]